MNRRVLFEANAELLARRFGDGRRRNLENIPSEYFAQLRALGVDDVWLMGLWQRSPAAREQALTHPDLQPQFRRALGDWCADDVDASPYAVHAYELDSRFGAPSALDQLRARLRYLGLRLIVDFVPNHLARDHPWTQQHPHRFVVGDNDSLAQHPDCFFSSATGTPLAHGKDPHFPPWTDTAQVNFFSPELRQSLIEELLRIARHADGVRCDMAMLALNDVFEESWRWAVREPRPTEEFWQAAITAVRAQRPDFVFIAEAYWGREPRLLELGFDYAYDRTLYDRLRHGDAQAIAAHVHEQGDRIARYVHFIENHDEQRSAEAFGPARARMAAMVTATLPGLQLLFDGQLEARRVRLPVQLVRAPEEPCDSEMQEFYRRLLPALLTRGQWQALPVNAAWDGNDSHRQMLSWRWHGKAAEQMTVINYSDAPAQGRIVLSGCTGRTLRLHDVLSSEEFVRDGDEAAGVGLYVELAAWSAHLFRITDDAQIA